MEIASFSPGSPRDASYMRRVYAVYEACLVFVLGSKLALGQKPDIRKYPWDKVVCSIIVLVLNMRTAFSQDAQHVNTRGTDIRKQISGIVTTDDGTLLNGISILFAENTARKLLPIKMGNFCLAIN